MLRKYGCDRNYERLAYDVYAFDSPPKKSRKPRNPKKKLNIRTNSDLYKMTQVSTSTFRSTYSQWRNVCHYCGVEVTGKEVSVDHIIPKCIDRKVANFAYNYLLTCHQCNNDKGSEDYIEFCKKIGMTPNYTIYYQALSLFRLRQRDKEVERVYIQSYYQPWKAQKVEDFHMDAEEEKEIIEEYRKKFPQVFKKKEARPNWVSSGQYLLQ